MVSGWSINWILVWDLEFESQRHWEDSKILVNAARIPSTVSVTGIMQAFKKRLFYKTNHCWHVKITAKGAEEETRFWLILTVEMQAHWPTGDGFHPFLCPHVCLLSSGMIFRAGQLKGLSQQYWKGLHLHSGLYYKDKTMHTIMVSCQLKVLWSNAILCSESGNYDLCHVLLESMKLYLQILMHSIIALC